MFNRILVPLDGSTLAERALGPAIVLARQSEGHVLLARVLSLEQVFIPDVHCYAGYGVIWPERAVDQARQEAVTYLEHIRNLRPGAPLAGEVVTAEGDVAGALIELAGRQACDLIVMSSHGYSGLTRWLLGSVAERVLGLASCPVLIVRSPRELCHILIPLDGSPLSEQALGPALALAASLGARVTLLRAVLPVESDEIQNLDRLEHGLGQRLLNDLWNEAGDYLDRLASTRLPGGMEVRTAVVHAPVAQSILQYAEAHAIDLIAMSTHGQTGLRRWVYGSVTEKVLRGGRHSMLVVRPA